jgi:HTH-type transcriptional regulator/antitoxin HigA
MTTAISRKKYAQLLAESLPRIIRSAKEHQKVMTEVQALMVRGDSLGPEEMALLQLMILLVEDYEKKNVYSTEDSATPLEILLHLMEAQEHTAKDLCAIIGDKGTVSKIISGEREISKTQAKRLGEHYHVSPALFI